MGHFHILKCEEIILPVPRNWKYHFSTLKDVEMPFPLEMKGYHQVIFQ